MSTASAPVSSCRRRRSAGSSTTRPGGEDRAGPRAGDAEPFALPEHAALLVDDAGGVDHGADLEPVETAGDAERDELARRDAAAGAEPDARGPRSRPAARPAPRRASRRRRYPVSVHAMLRTVSFMLPVASYAADGSNPEWIPQCSQRGSLPGP